MQVGEIVVEEENVVEVDDQVVLVNEVGKNVVHEGLEGGRSIAKSKGHD